MPLRAALENRSCDEFKAALLELMRQYPPDYVKMVLNDYGAWYLMLFAVTMNSLDIVQILLQLGTDVHEREDLAVRTAAYHGRYEIVRALLDHGADVRAMNDESIKVAADHYNYNLFELLKARGANADVNVRTRAMNKMLHSWDYALDVLGARVLCVCTRYLIRTYFRGD